MVRVIDINASAVHGPAADRLALHQTTCDTSLAQLFIHWVHGCTLQVTKSARLGYDVITREPVSNRFLQTGYRFCCRNGSNIPGWHGRGSDSMWDVLMRYRTEVLVTLTTDVGKLLSKLSQVRPKGNINFVSAVRIAHVGNTCWYSSVVIIIIIIILNL